MPRRRSTVLQRIKRKDEDGMYDPAYKMGVSEDWLK